LTKKSLAAAMFQADTLQINPADLLQFEAACRKAVRLAGAVLMDRVGNVTPWRKAKGDWVCEADVESQRVIREFLLELFPDHRFLGEEHLTDSSGNAKHSSDYCWIVDPLDGTVNFLHQLHSFSVSIALTTTNSTNGVQQILTGAVFDPALDELFGASAGRGASLNGEPIQASPCCRVADALTVVSTNTAIPPDDPQIKRMVNVMGTPASMRRLGSAALNLCYIACGRVDAYWATNLNCWDIAAGWLIAAEAGAVLEDFDGAPLNLMQPKFCCAATRQLMDELRPLLCVN
jgi:myo-inositol-1(or 4)-monophosphatase